MLTITPVQRRSLRADAHSLHPVVAIGQHGATAAVMHEIDVALLAHELIKVRVFDNDRAEREGLLARICAELGCVAVQHIGKLLVLWRPNPDKAETPTAKKATAPPREKAKPSARNAKTKATGTAAGSRKPPRGDSSRRRRRTTES